MPADDPLLDAYRVIRRIDPPEAPWPGLLVHTASGGASVLVDMDDLGEEWPGWSAPADGHLMGPLDLVRRPGGHAAAMPVCTERLDDFLARRGDAPLSDGEALTIAVSLLRGLTEAAEREIAGTWWLVEGGRPAFAAHRGGEPIAIGVERLLLELARTASPALATALGEAIETAREPERLARGLARLEDRLFAVASPEPLATTVFAPRRARALAIADTHGGAELDEPGDGGVIGRLARHVDADLADAFSRATTAVWRKFRAAPADGTPRRRRPLLVAGGAAAAVLAAGLLWPTSGVGPATADGRTETASAASTATPGTTAADAPADASTAPAEAAAASTPEVAAAADAASLESVLDALLAARADCAGEKGCLAAVTEDPSRGFPPGPIDLPSAERAITLLDEFGGAAVLRVAAASGGAAQLAVIVRADEKWVLRDVHDVAEHPD